MNRQGWNVGKFSVLGAIIGVLLAIIQEWQNMNQVEYFSGLLVGSALGGAALFAAVSLVRNMVVRR